MWSHYRHAALFRLAAFLAALGGVSTQSNSTAPPLVCAFSDCAPDLSEFCFNGYTPVAGLLCPATLGQGLFQIYWGGGYGGRAIGLCADGTWGVWNIPSVPPTNCSFLLSGFSGGTYSLPGERVFYAFENPLEQIISGNTTYLDYVARTWTLQPQQYTSYYQGHGNVLVNYTFTCAPETSSPPPVVVAVPPPPAPPHHGGAPYFQTLVPLSAPVDTSAQVALPPPEVDLFERVVRYTLAFWFTATSACPESPGEPFQSLVLRGANDTDRTPAVYLRNGFLYPRHQTTSGSDAGLPNQFSTSYVQPNTWTHVALVVNGSAMQLYVNGTFDSGGALPGGANFTWGARNATSFVAGLGYCNAPSSVKGVVWLNGAARGAEVASLAAGAAAGKAASSTTSTTTSDSSADAPPCGLVDMTQCCQGTYFCGNCSAWDISYAQGNTMFCSGQSFAPNIVAMCEIYASSGFFFPPLTPACPSPPPSPPPSPQPPSPAPPSPTPPLPPWSSPSLPPTPSPPASLLPPWSPPLMNAPPSPSAYLSPPWMSPSVSPPLANAPPSPPASLSPPWASPPWSPPLMDAPPSPSSPLPLSSPPQPSSPLPSPLAPPLASDGSLPPAPPISDQATIAALQAQLAVLASRMPPALCPSASPFLQRGESGVWTCVPLPIAISAAGDVCRASVVDGANATIACDQPQPAAVPVPPDCMPPGAAWLGYNASAGGWVCTCSIGYTGTSCDILL